MEEPLRLRIIFADRKMLKKSLRSEGLKHCWLLLNPSIATISDLESHVRQTFHLNRSCPNGIVLYMDDFVLPPFESTCILKDKDIIRVRKKDASWMDVIEHDHDPHRIQDSGVLNKKNTIDAEKLMAITGFGEDADQHDKKSDKAICIHDENAISMGSPSKSKNKRKHSEGILGPKTKKSKTCSIKTDNTGEEDENIQITVEVVDIDLGKSLGSSPKRGGSLGCSDKSDGPSAMVERQSISSQLVNNIERVTGCMQSEKRTKKSKTCSIKTDNTGEEDENIQNTVEVVDIDLGKSLGSSPKRGGSLGCSDKSDGPSAIVERQSISSHLVNNIEQVTGCMQSEKRGVQAKENIEGNTCAPHVNGCERENTQSQIPTTVVNKESSEKQGTELNTEMEKGIVPVVVRPGHIRFQSLDEEQCPWQPQETMGTLQRSGTTSNNKGQKWRSENNVSKWNDFKCYKELSAGKEKTASKWNDANGNRGPKWFRENPGSKWNDSDGYKGQNWAENSKCKWNHANGNKGFCNTSAGRWSDANGYKGQKCVQQDTGSKWNDASGSNEQFIGKKTTSTWNDAICYKDQYNAKAGNWGNANGYKGQKWVGENSGSKWNDADGFKEQFNTKVNNWGNINGFKGQNWVRENVQNKWNAANGHIEQSNGNEVTVKQWTDANGYNEQYTADGHIERNNGVSISLKEKTESRPFETLFPLTRIPQVGDVLAYRLIESSPSWCPKVSSFRVGEVASYNHLSMSIILVPVPEFPIFFDEDIERIDSAYKSKPLPYNEDGSLQIHYPSLVDVRLLKASNLVATTSDLFEREMNIQATALVNKWEQAIVNANAKETVSQPKENGNPSSLIWDQMKQTLNKKTVQQQQQQQDGWDEWTANKRIGSTSWTHQAMRGNVARPNQVNMRGRSGKYPYTKQVPAWHSR